MDFLYQRKVMCLIIMCCHCRILESFIKSNWTLASQKEICSAARTEDFCSGDISELTSFHIY